MEERYIKLYWPEYQEYMEYPGFKDLCGFDPDQNAYYIPEYIIDESEQYPEEIIYNGAIYKTTIDYKKGDEVLFENEDGTLWTSICIALGKTGLPDLFENEPEGKIFGINYWAIGVKI